MDLAIGWHINCSLFVKSLLTANSCEGKTEGRQKMDLQEGVVTTASPLRAWYLTKFRGLKIRAVRSTPILTALGVLYYSRYWVLVSATSQTIQ